MLKKVCGARMFGNVLLGAIEFWPECLGLNTANWPVSCSLNSFQLTVDTGHHAWSWAAFRWLIPSGRDCGSLPASLQQAWCWDDISFRGDAMDGEPCHPVRKMLIRDVAWLRP